MCVSVDTSQECRDMLTYEDYENSEDLEHEPPVARYARIVLQQLPLRTTDIRSDVDRVCVYTLHGLPLLRHHLCKLCEDLPEFCDSRLDRLYRGRTRLDVCVLHTNVSITPSVTSLSRSTHLRLDQLHLHECVRALGRSALLSRPEVQSKDVPVTRR